ncbi:hypothetical protein HDV05_005704 [Chytridiales sp. JEL 0842]|nr:hypothetical protein HDV05_005704 [Chytridiales sp. JEL 0842]
MSTFLNKIPTAFTMFRKSARTKIAMKVPNERGDSECTLQADDTQNMAISTSKDPKGSNPDTCLPFTPTELRWIKIIKPNIGKRKYNVWLQVVDSQGYVCSDYELFDNSVRISKGFWDVFVQKTGGTPALPSCGLPGGLQGSIKPVVNDPFFIRLIKFHEREDGGKVVEFEALEMCGLTTVHVVTIKKSEDFFKSVNKRVLRFNRRELERCSVESALKAEVPSALASSDEEVAPNLENQQVEGATTTNVPLPPTTNIPLPTPANVLPPPSQSLLRRVAKRLKRLVKKIKFGCVFLEKEM